MDYSHCEVHCWWKFLFISSCEIFLLNQTPTQMENTKKKIVNDSQLCWINVGAMKLQLWITTFSYHDSNMHFLFMLGCENVSFEKVTFSSFSWKLKLFAFTYLLDAVTVSHHQGCDQIRWKITFENNIFFCGSSLRRIQ